MMKLLALTALVPLCAMVQLPIPSASAQTPSPARAAPANAVPPVALPCTRACMEDLADRFLAHMLARNIRIEEDLIDQLFNSSEKRLARALLLLARYGTEQEQLLLPKVSQETLARIVGTTRSRVNFFMNKFRDLGFLEYDGAITVHRSLLTVVLHD